MPVILCVDLIKIALFINFNEVGGRVFDLPHRNAVAKRAGQRAVSSASPRSFGGIVWTDQLFNPEEQLFGVKRFGEKFEVVATALGVF